MHSTCRSYFHDLCLRHSYLVHRDSAEIITHPNLCTLAARSRARTVCEWSFVIIFGLYTSIMLAQGANTSCITLKDRRISQRFRIKVSSIYLHIQHKYIRYCASLDLIKTYPQKFRFLEGQKSFLTFFAFPYMHGVVRI